MTTKPRNLEAHRDLLLEKYKGNPTAQGIIRGAYDIASGNLLTEDELWAEFEDEEAEVEWPLLVYILDGEGAED